MLRRNSSRFLSASRTTSDVSFARAVSLRVSKVRVVRGGLLREALRPARTPGLRQAQRLRGLLLESSHF